MLTSNKIQHLVSVISETIISEQISKRHLVCERQLHCTEVLIINSEHKILSLFSFSQSNGLLWHLASEAVPLLTIVLQNGTLQTK
jgi:hypothetical protein